MVNAGIDEGDYVVVRKQDTAEVGQIIVARVDDKTSLKRYYLDPQRKKIILHPENESYEDQTFDEVDIQGIAKMVIKALH